ncbi:M16 family metallopeptidase [Vibrio maerlii]|uniref:M16 family metallopeptidase n=1 Tax=Vibrio maerlii TaxID=2231648 RepID=UPI000E3BCDCB|nr:pitrilysin family protein [Vibrio maerlii]
MRRVVLSALVALALTACGSSTTSPVSSTSNLPSGITLLETQQASADKVSIPYEKYQLDNGLTVMLSPDDSDPLVHVDVTYHVGSAREEIGKSGFAHFFEHMMFQGSENVGDQQHFKLITEAGGTLNGTTNRDRTNYFETVPSNQLEKVLWLEADRMGFLLDAVSQRKFEIQRDTVKNERAQNYENRPYGLMWETMGQAMYPEGHPYSWQPIGYVEDLDRVDVQDLKSFFLRWYGPNNAVLTIGGDIDTKETLEWVNKYFGTIPKGPEVESAPKQPATLNEDKYVTLEDNIRQPMVVIGWPTTYLGDENQASFNALANVLGGGKNSVLYQDLVKTQIALDAGAFHDCGELACNMYVYAMGKAGDEGDLTPLYDALQVSLESFEQTGVTQDRLDQITGMAEANAVFALESVRGKVTQLASNETFFNQPDRIESQLEQIRQVTPNSVNSLYQTYLNGHNKVVLSVVPKGKTNLAAQEATFKFESRDLPETKKVTEDELVYRKAVDNFDRSIMPEVAEPVKAEVPKLYRLHFSNGAELLGTDTSEVPTVQIQIDLPAGDRYVPRGKEGLASLTAALLNEGTVNKSSEQIEAELDRLGSAVSIRSSNYTTTVSISSLTKDLPQTLALVEEILLEPRFDEQDFERLKQQTLQGLIYQHQRPQWLASQATRQVLFGNSVYARSDDGTERSVATINLEDVKAFYRSHYTPQGAQIVVVGDINKPEVQKQLKFIQEWEGDIAPMLRPQLVKKPEGQSIFLIDKPNAPQSIVRLVRNSVSFDATGELYLMQLANFNLAGNFNSRINQNLREDKGYTYGAGGYFASNREVGAGVFYAQVRADSTVESIKELQKELALFSAEGVTEEELRFMQLAMGQKDALKYETPSQKANLLGGIIAYNLDEDYLQQRARILEQMDLETLNQVAEKWFNPDDYQIIVVGDAKSLEPQLESLNIPIQKLEIER